MRVSSWLLVAGVVLFAEFASAAEPTQTTITQLDALLEAKWKAAKVTPEAQADDATFVRRVWLDLAGRVPPALKARAFLDDTRSDKRSRLVEELLAGEEFADHWSLTWTIRLTEKRPIRQDTYDARVLREYLHDSLLANKSYREVVRELLTGDGLQDASGAANFLLRYQVTPEILAGAVSKQFMGTTLQCAQCHDHVFAKWKKDDFWGLAAFFGRTKRLTTEDGLGAILEARRGELQVPDPMAKKNDDGSQPMKTIAPKLPGRSVMKLSGPRRQALADWLTADDNPYFARHAVNQVWNQLFGVALVGNLDDLGAAAKSRHGDILELLSQDFSANGYDLKRLVRALVSSRAYQLQATGDASTEAKLDNFARFRMRTLTVDQLYAALAQATGHHGDEDVVVEEQQRQDAAYEEATPDRPVELLGEHGLTMQRALVLLNGEYIHQATQAGAKLSVTLNGRRIGSAHVEWLFLGTLARRPTADESKVMLDLVRSDKGVKGLEDALWVILNSAEFNSNH